MGIGLSKSLLIGASGQIGAQILHLLGHQKCLVSSRNSLSAGEIALDLSQIATKADADKVLGGHPLDAIFCIGGMTNVEACEDVPDLAYRTNCRGPEMLASIAADRDVPFVYFSSEYVFDGNDGPYSEDSPTNPLNVYGKSKRDGELAVLAAWRRALVLRTTVVYGQDFGQKNYIYSLIRSIACGRTMRVPDDQISTPTYNRDLAYVTIELVKRSASGILHVCGPERMDRLEFAQSVTAYLGLDDSLLQGLPTRSLGQRAPRPLSAGLSINKLLQLYPDLPMRSLAEGLADCRHELEGFANTLRCGVEQS